MLHHPVDGNIGDAGAHKQVQSHRRRTQADGQVEHHDGAKVDGIHPKALYDRQEDRHQDHNGRRGLHQHAHQQQEQIDEQQDQILVLRQREDKSCDGRGDLLHGQHTAERRGTAHQDHDRTGGQHGLVQHLRQILQLHAAIDEEADDQRIGRGHDRRLRGREYAAVNTAQNDKGDQHCPDGVLEDRPEGALILLVLFGKLRVELGAATCPFSPSRFRPLYISTLNAILFLQFFGGCCVPSHEFPLQKSLLQACIR